MQIILSQVQETINEAKTKDTFNEITMEENRLRGPRMSARQEAKTKTFALSVKRMRKCFPKKK